MLYHWTGAAYRSKQENCAPVIVAETSPIVIARSKDGAMGYFPLKAIAPAPLWLGEGFGSQQAMDDWFSALLQPGGHVEKHMMLFRLWEEGAE